MANRRMFSKVITSSTRFLKMPVSSQNLYFHLGMNADDDGVVEAFPIMNMIGANEDDLKVLVAKEFVTVLNNDWVSFINDWLENNNIRADRKVDSIYKDLLLEIKPDARIKMIALQPNDNQVSDICQQKDRIGKDRLGKDRLGKDSIGKNKENIDYNGVLNAYHSLCPSYPKVKVLSDARKKAIKARLNYCSMEDLEEAFRKAEASDFLKGKNDRNWQANFDWIIKDSNLAKILDGNYDNKKIGDERNGTNANNCGLGCSASDYYRKYTRQSCEG